MSILSGVSLLIKNIFLIQFLFKTDEYPLWGVPPPQAHVPYVFNSNSKLMNILSGVPIPLRKSWKDLRISLYLFVLPKE